MEKKKKGRQPIFDCPMTGAERVARYRIKHNKAKDTYTVVLIKEIKRQDKRIEELEGKLNNLISRFA